MRGRWAELQGRQTVACFAQGDQGMLCQQPDRHPWPVHEHGLRLAALP